MSTELCTEENVLTWIRQVQTKTDGDLLERVVSDIALNDPPAYYNGKKEPRVLSFGQITRQLSDSQGQWQGSTMRWRESETDLTLRQRFANALTRAVGFTTVMMHMIRESVWVAKGEAILMFIGHLLSVTPNEDLTIDLEAGDELTRDLEIVGNAVQCPRRLFDAAFTLGIGDDLIAKPEPIIYGKMTDELSVTVPPDMYGSAPWGGYMAGPFARHGWAPKPNPPAKPTGVTLTQVGSGSIMLGDQPSNEIFVVVTSLDGSGNESDPDVYEEDQQTLVTKIVISADNSKVQVNWTAPVGFVPSGYRVYFGYFFFFVRYSQVAQVGAGVTTFTFDNAPSFLEVQANVYSEIATGATGLPSGYAYYKVSALMGDAETGVSPVFGYGYMGVGIRSIRVQWTAVVGALGYRVWKFLPGRYVPYMMAEVDGVTLMYDDNVFDSDMDPVSSIPREIGLLDLAPYYGGLELVPFDGQYWHRWFVASHACAMVQPYLNSQITDQGGDSVENDVVSIKLATEAGVDWLWPGATGYVERFGNAHYRDFNGRRYSVIYGRGGNAQGVVDGQIVVKAAKGTSSISTNNDNIITLTDADDGPSSLSIEVVSGFGSDVILTAAITGAAIVVTLGTDGAGALDPAKNTAAHVATAINNLTGVSAKSSGDGSGVVTGPSGPVGFGGGVTGSTTKMFLRANVYGVEPNADGTGAVITDVFDQELHWWVNFGPLGDYQSGAYLPMPTWDPISSIDKINVDTWTACRDAAAADITGGIVGAGALLEQLPMRDWIAKWRLSTDTRIGQNSSGQWMIVREDPTASVTRIYTEMNHVQELSVRLDPLYDEHWTEIPYTYGIDREQKWLDSYVYDDDEELAYDEVRIGPSFELFFIRHPEVALYLMTRVLERHKTLPWRVTWETINLCGTASELGDVVGLTGSWGLGPNGWDEFPIAIELHSVMPDSQRTQIVGRANVPPHLV